MNRTDIPKDRLAAYIAAVEEALKKAEINDNERRTLVDLAVEEAASALINGEDKPFGEIPESFGFLMKQVRLSGELPLYLARIIALWLKSNGAKPGSVKDEIEKICGLHYEREAIWLIADCFNTLPDLGLDERSRKKAELMKTAHRKGYEYEKVYGGCAQCTYATVTDITGETNDGIFRAANAFAAGMGGMGDCACGAYSGGLMAFGMFTGRRREFFDADLDEKAFIGKISRELREKFIEVYGTAICHGIHKEIFGRAYLVADPEEKEAFDAAGAHSLDKCPVVVGMASAWTVEILFEHGFIDFNEGSV